MSHRRIGLLALIVAIVAAALVLAGFSLQGRTVTVTHVALTATLVDNGAAGPSVGDVRLFEVPTAIKGSTPGRMDACMTTTGVNVPDEGSEIRMTTLVFTFQRAKDQIVVSGASVYPAAGSVLAADSVTVRPIVGGSGAYSGASGWCESTHFPDGTWRHVFHLER